MPSRLAGMGMRLADRLGWNGEARVHYHLGRPNFGDDINPWFWSLLSGARFRWGSPGRRHLLGVGSIADRASPRSWVMGSGLLRPPGRAGRPLFERVVAVRGALTAEALGVSPPHLGDPVGLVDLLVPRPSPEAGRFGVVPHVISVAEWRRALAGRRDVAVIDPSGDPADVIRAIASCEGVASQSLHGLVVADAYGIPAIWVDPAPGMVGGRFKFDDYFTSLASAREPVGLRALAEGARDLPWEVARARGDKRAYLEHLRRGVAAFLAESGGG